MSHLGGLAGCAGLGLGLGLLDGAGLRFSAAATAASVPRAGAVPSMLAR